MDLDLTATANLRGTLFVSLFSTYGQQDAQRTDAIADQVLTVLHAQVAPTLVRDFVTWVVSLDRDVEKRATVTVDQVVACAAQALVLPAGFVVSSNVRGEINDPASPEVERAYFAAGVYPLVQFTRYVVGLADPNTATFRSVLRDAVTLLDLVNYAHDAIHECGKEASRRCV
jgi:hypothetical protein